MRIGFSSAKNVIVIVGIDQYKRKNEYQVRLGSDEGYAFHIFSHLPVEDEMSPIQEIGVENRIYSLKGMGLKGLLVYFFALVRSVLVSKHIELYPTSQLALAYLILGKLCSKVIVVERGDVGFFQNYSLWVRLSMRCCYKLADCIWYKEPYMKQLLKKITQSEKLVFLPNSVELNKKDSTIDWEQRGFNFCWVNRIIEARRLEWFANS